MGFRYATNLLQLAPYYVVVADLFAKLFAGNVALPMIAYVYWRDEVSSFRLTCINIATLAGTLLGQVAFGFLGDKNGRKKMYGIELVLLIGSTLGVVMSSRGYNGSMSIYSWLIWWRIMVGIGVGADYPLSAVITAESVSLSWNTTRGLC